MRRKSAANEIPVADLPDESIDGSIDGVAQIEEALDAGFLRDAVNALPAAVLAAVLLFLAVSAAMVAGNVKLRIENGE